MASSSAGVETRAPVAAAGLSFPAEGGVDVPRRNGAGGVTISGGLLLELLPMMLGAWIGPL